MAFSVFTRIEDTPGYAMLVDAIQRHAGEEAAVERRKIFSLGEAAEIQQLLEAAGFRDISIEAFDYVAHFPSPDEFLRQEIARSLETAQSREWLVTNGIGGFAYGTVAGILTRRYKIRIL